MPCPTLHVFVKLNRLTFDRHLGLLHAICALASLYSPIITDPKLDKARWNAAGGLFGPDIQGPLDPTDGEERRFPKTFYDLRGAWEEGFGVTHIRLASMCLRISLRDGDRVLQLVQGIYSRSPDYNHSEMAFVRVPEDPLYVRGTPTVWE